MNDIICAYPAQIQYNAACFVALKGWFKFSVPYKIIILIRGARMDGLRKGIVESFQDYRKAGLPAFKLLGCDIFNWAVFIKRVNYCPVQG